MAGRGAKGALPARVPDPDPLADPGGIDARPHRFDHPCPIRMGHDARINHLGAHPRARAQLHIRRVHPRGFQRHQDLARPGLRRRHLAKLQHIMRRTKALIPNSLHHTLPSSSFQKYPGGGAAQGRDWGSAPPNFRRKIRTSYRIQRALRLSKNAAIPSALSSLSQRATSASIVIAMAAASTGPARSATSRLPAATAPGAARR